MRQTFASKIAKGADFQRALKMFSVSDQDAMNREAAICRVIENTMEINEMYNKRRGFAASVSAANLAGSSVYAAIMRSFVNSIAPIFAVQRSMDTPIQELMYVDFYDVLNKELIVPNIGADKEWISKDSNASTEVLDPKSDWTLSGADPIIPRSFVAELYKGDQLKGRIVDDGAGNLLASPGILGDNSMIQYNNGGTATVLLNWAAGLDADKLSYKVLFDQTSKDVVNRAFGKTDYYRLATEPLLVPVERNILADHAMAKQGIVNNDELYANFVENEYTKAINNKVFKSLVNNYVGDTWQIDLSNFSLAAGKVDTLKVAFKNAINQGENRIAENTYKEAKITGILAGHEACDMFNLLDSTQGWVKNMNRSYYKDIVGWLDEVPVVLANTPGLASDEAILTHRTADGQIAPLFHGMFLAPTELPIVANYAQLTDYSTGLYSMEGFGYTSSKLCLKMKFKAPQDIKIARM